MMFRYHSQSLTISVILGHSLSLALFAQSNAARIIHKFSNKKLPELIFLILQQFVAIVNNYSLAKAYNAKTTSRLAK